MSESLNASAVGAGDVVGGDKISVGSVTGAQAVAIGRGAQAIVNITELSKSDRLDQRNRGILLSKIQDFWIDEVFVPSVQENQYILLDQETQPDAVVNRLRAAARLSRGEQVYHGQHIADIFEQVGRSLLILGELGAGKTTALLALTDHAIPLAARDLNEPMPIVLNLSSWRQGIPLDRWIGDELNGIYHVPRSTAAQWLREGGLLLLLDGLDEVNSADQSQCVLAINAFRAEYGLTPLVVTCRESVYRSLSVRLELEGAVRIRPLTTPQIERYIGEKLQPLRQAIADDETLAQMATNFLTLTLLIEATLAGRLDAVLAQDDEKARMRSLLDASQQALLDNLGGDAESGTITRHDRWLAWLATRMVENHQSVFLLERMQPTWLKRFERVVYVVLVTAILAAITFPVLLSFLWLDAGGTIVGIIAALAIGLAVAIWDPIRPVETLRFSLASLKKNALRWGLAGAGAGGLVGLVLDSSYVFSPESGGVIGDIMLELAITAGLFGLTGLILGGLMGGLQSSQVDRTSKPNQGIRRSGLYAIVVGGVFALLTWGIMSLTVGASWPEIPGVFGALMFGGAAWIQHAVLRGVLFVFGHAPLRMIRFLETATDKDILRRVGGGYMFAHRSLQQHFADLTSDDDLIRSQPTAGPLLAASSLTAPAAMPLPALADTAIAAVSQQVLARRLDLQPGEDLYRQLQKYCEDNAIDEAIVLSYRIGLRQAVLATGGIDGPLHVAGLNGRVGQREVDLHLLVLDEAGGLRGGALAGGTTIGRDSWVMLGVLAG